MSRLKLAAADAEDLQVLSARLQDAVVKLKNFVWLPKKRRLSSILRTGSGRAASERPVIAGRPVPQAAPEDHFLRQRP